MKYVLILSMLLSVTLNAQDIVTDRPDQTESSRTIPIGAFQVESGVAVTFNGKAELQTKQLILPTMLIRYGITDGFELRLFSQVEKFEDNFNEEKFTGLSDLEVGFKGQIIKKKDLNTEIAVMSHLIIPSGSTGLSINEFGVINKISISHELSEMFSLGYNIGYDKIGSAKGAATYSIALGASLTDSWGVYAEPYGSYSGDNIEEHNFDTGITYLCNENLQLDLSAGLGLTESMNYVALGFSWVTKK